MTTSGYDIVVKRDRLTEARAVVRPPADPRALRDNEIVCRIDTYAFTANNLTYGVAGDSIGYWKFFPAAAPGFGRIPVWGFATVTATRQAEVNEGERLYGYWPMSTDVVLDAGQVSPTSLTDVAQHRASLPTVYNRYARLAGDRSFPAGSEPYQALLRPLFLTSYLIEDFLEENGFFGAKSVIVGSASSKTGIGLAATLAARSASGIRIIGLTSRRNVSFVERLGLYHEVRTYDRVPALSAPDGAVFVDMAGSLEVIRDVHTALGRDLKYSCRVGLSHWQDAAPARGLDVPGPKPLFFFAPDRIAKRITDWGAAGFMQKTGAALGRFIADSPRWLKVEHVRGDTAILAAYAETAAGTVAPDRGLMFEP
jgi:hypothetical protein